MQRQPSSSSDEEEDDGVALIDAKNTAQHRSPVAFEVGGPVSGRICRRFGFGVKCLIAVSVSLLFVLIIYVYADLRHVLKGAPAARVGPPLEDSGMREAELRALFLVRNQRLGLLRLWNRTSVAHPRSGGSNSSQVPPGNQGEPSALQPSISFEELRSALIEQIKLNQQIQKALLSTHGMATRNSSSEELDDNVDDSLVGYGGVKICRKVGKPMNRRTIEWRPRQDKFLFVICLSGQMSNHLICLQKHMFFAALLGRTLILPSPKFDYQYDSVIDIEHINTCFGTKAVISFEDFSAMKKNKMKIDRFICYMASPPCFLDDEHEKRLKSLGLTLAKLEPAWPETKSTQVKKRTVEDVTSKFSSDEEVLAVGDLFYADVEEEWVMQAGGPLAHKCQTVIRPSRLILLTAQRFVQTFLGSNYVALHFRRHGFLKFCNVKEESCFFPVPQAAECILRVVEKANAPVVYLSTDAAESETYLLQSLVVLNNKAIPLVKRPEHNTVEKWDALLYRNHFGGDNQVEAMLDKTICAMASVFIGTSGSTFTDDIFRLRKDWGSSSICDENLCQGEKPNFVADQE